VQLNQLHFHQFNRPNFGFWILDFGLKYFFNLNLKLGI
jgi:hypothetical protein